MNKKIITIIIKQVVMVKLEVMKKEMKKVIKKINVIHLIIKKYQNI